MKDAKKVAVLVSGGVDSSVALCLLQEQGYNVTAFYLKIWLEDELSYLGDCPWEQDLAYVRKVCEQLNVPLQIVPLQKEYQDEVVTYTIAQVKVGRTPNPDILCNTRIKFGLFLHKIDELYNFDYVATGHYAHVCKDANGVQLRCAPDPVKDQTYFLSHLSQEQLNRILFPLGTLNKTQVRQLAHQFNLPTKDRKDSQGICFLGKLKFRDFVKHYLGEQQGPMIETETGKQVGQHAGFWFYTIGQRQGLRLPGGPWYVAAKDVDKNIVYVSRSYHAPDKHRDTFAVYNPHWIGGKEPNKKQLQVKIRHGAHRYNCTIAMLDDNRMRIQLVGRDQGIAPGQFAVFYDGDVCLGSGVIERSL